MVDNDLLWHCTIAAFTINFVTSAEVITLCSYLCLSVRASDLSSVHDAVRVTNNF